MAAEYWYTIAGATHDLPYDAWTLGAGANKNVAVRIGGGRSGPPTHDDDTSYVNATGAQRQAFNVDWPGPVLAFASITAGFRIRESNVAAQNVQQEFANAAGTLGSGFNATDPIGTYGTVGPADAAARRPGGGTWVPADFLNDQTTFATLVSNATGVRATSVFGVLTYTAPSGGFAFLLASMVLGALVDFAQFERYLSWRRIFHPRHTLLSGDEVRRAWRELREYRHPTFFFPAVAR